MGLDMYLEKRTFIGNEYRKPKKRVQILVPKKQKEGRKRIIADELKIRTERITGIVERVGYWRKADAIHAWFVREVQEEKDDCGEYRVEGEELRELLTMVNRVIAGIADPKLAADLLPTQPGFGGTDYGKGYLADLVRTKQILEEILLEDPEGEYYYHASW